jgi:hypothetical protein
MKNKILRERLVTYGLVTIVAMAIWLYAENENIKEYKDFAIDIQLVAAQSDLVIDKRAPVRVLVDFKCARSQREAISKRVQTGPIKIPIIDNPEDISQQLIITELLNTHADLQNLGLTVDKADPATMDVRVEKLVEIELPIEIDPGRLQLLGTPRINPEGTKVKIRIPTSVAKAIEGQDLRATARLGTLKSSELPVVNEPAIRQIELTLPDQLGDAEPDITRIKVNFTLKKVTTQYTMPNVPILIEAPLTTMSEYRVTLATDQPPIRDVVLEGPNDVIEKIANGDLSVSAVLKLTTAELDNPSPPTSKLLHITTPELVNVKSEYPRVKFKITKIATPVAPTTP